MIKLFSLILISLIYIPINAYSEEFSLNLLCKIKNGIENKTITKEIINIPNGTEFTINLILKKSYPIKSIITGQPDLNKKLTIDITNNDFLTLYVMAHVGISEVNGEKVIAIVDDDEISMNIKTKDGVSPMDGKRANFMWDFKLNRYTGAASINGIALNPVSYEVLKEEKSSNTYKSIYTIKETKNNKDKIIKIEARANEDYGYIEGILAFKKMRTVDIMRSYEAICKRAKRKF